MCTLGIEPGIVCIVCVKVACNKFISDTLLIKMNKNVEESVPQLKRQSNIYLKNDGTTPVIIRKSEKEIEEEMCRMVHYLAQKEESERDESAGLSYLTQKFPKIINK